MSRKQVEFHTIRVSHPRITLFQKIKLVFHNRQDQLMSGLVLLAVGIASTAIGIRPISGLKQLYFYWSFTYVNPFADLPPGIYPGFPLVVQTYEILVPWILIGILFILMGTTFIFKGKG